MAEIRRTIKQWEKEAADAQLKLFDEEERRQREHDLDALRARLAELDAGRETEPKRQRQLFKVADWRAHPIALQVLFPCGKRLMSIRRRIADKQHRWLSQVDLSGVVLSEPVLAEAAPAGFRNLEKRELAQFYKAREIWNLPVGMVEGDTEAQWIGFVLEQLLDLATARWQIGAAIASRFVVALSQQRETLRPTRVLLDGAEPILVFLRVPRTQKLDSPWDTGGSWKASPTTKLERLLRETGVEIGLVTNGEAWRLVVASPSETAAWLTWTTQTWADSPRTLSAFVDLLGETRFFAGPRTGTILELVRRSRERQADVAEQLGTQVREALELFVREVDRVDASVDGDLLRSYTEDEVFEGVAALLMRLVFLLKAEEGGLLPHGSIVRPRPMESFTCSLASNERIA